MKHLTHCLAAAAVALGISAGATAAEKISSDVLRDKIAGAWIGQMVGNIYGLPFENKFVDEPASESRFPFGYTKNIDKLKKYDGAFSDDDTDVEYIYLTLMEKYGIDPTYAQMRQGWMHHIRDRVWLANRAALGLMHLGYTPPFTGRQDLNPHWYQIDPQLINEIWAYTAPGMPAYAVGKSDWAARITSDSWAVQPTALYGAMYAEAFFEKDVKKLIEKGLKYLPENDRYTLGVKKCLDIFRQYPNDWVKARQIIADEYYMNEDPMTKTIWNADLNGLMGILAMLYGNGDFTETLDIAARCGQDADCNPATAGGVLGVMKGYDGIPAFWLDPLKEVEDLNFEGTDMSLASSYRMSFNQALQLITKNGGERPADKVVIPTAAPAVLPLEQNFTNTYPLVRERFDAFFDKEFEFSFTGNGFVIWGNICCLRHINKDYINRVSTRHIGSEVFGLAEPDDKYVANVEVWIDGKLDHVARMPMRNTDRRVEPAWKYLLPEGHHTVRLVWTNPNKEYTIRINDIMFYSDHPNTNRFYSNLK